MVARFCNRFGLLTLSALFVGLASAWPADAGAIPAFARKYGISCKTCHEVAYPALNPFGQFFKKNGYQMPTGAEEPSLELTYKKPDKNLALFEQFPIAFRAKSTLFVRTQTEPGESAVEFVTPTTVDLLSGGAIFRNVSYFINFGIFANGQVEAPELAFVQFNNLGGEGMANVRVGKFNLLDFQYVNHRNLTISTAQYATVAVGDNPFVLDTHHIGIDVYGQPNWGPVFYEIAVVNGAQGHTEVAAGGHGGGHGGLSGTDVDKFKDIYARLAFSLPDRKTTFGVLGYTGKARLPVEGAHTAEEGEDHGEMDMAGEAASFFDDRFRIAGADADLTLGRLNLFGTFLWGKHDNPHGEGESVSYQSLMAQALYMIRRDLLGVLRYDRVFSNDDPGLERQFLTPYITYLVLDNVRLAAEYSIDLDDFDRSRFYFTIDFAL